MTAPTPIHETAEGDLKDWIFDGGDVKITFLLEDNVYTTKVSSHAMLLASPVWKKFIFPPWDPQPTAQSQIEPHSGVQESVMQNNALSSLQDSVTQDTSTPSSNTTEKSIDFTEDNAVALLLILQIAHLQFGKLSTQISSEKLLELAKLSDQYQCVGVLKPWIDSWIESAELQGPDWLGKENWLFIYWVFGRDYEFAQYSYELVFEVELDKSGQYCTEQGNNFPQISPPDIFGKEIIDVSIPFDG